MTVSEAWNMRCPSCGKDDELDVQMKVWGRLKCDGTDCDASVDGDHEWSDESLCACGNCGWRGTVAEAEIPKDDES
jgi:hypothetical protein